MSFTPQPCPPWEGTQKVLPASFPSPSWATSTRHAPALAVMMESSGAPPHPAMTRTASGVSALTKVPLGLKQRPGARTLLLSSHTRVGTNYVLVLYIQRLCPHQPRLLPPQEAPLTNLGLTYHKKPCLTSSEHLHPPSILGKH